VSDPAFDAEEWQVVRSYADSKRVDKLRAADSLVRSYMLSQQPELMAKIWQSPVILLPLVNKRTKQESIVLRPVDSIDGMTASFMKLPKGLLKDLARTLGKQLQLHVFFDVTNKPPATIEWE
jgi:GMP synthase (glutamine-hydrolysing)